ncbi:MAG: ATP-binding protein, partial [Ekhidna sp.]
MTKPDQNMAYTNFKKLISNALKLKTENGKISITCKSENDNVMISIKDTGVGMPKEKV